MATRLELAKGKLARLKNETSNAFIQSKKAIENIPFGQPNIIGRPDIYRDFKRYNAKAMRIYDEIEKQEDRIEMLEKVEDFKNENELLKDVHVVGKTAYATIGAKTSVNNIDYFKNQLIELERKNEENKKFNRENKGIDRKATYGADITKLKNKIAYLESIQNIAIQNDSTMTDKTKSLIESGAVNQWKKKPIYYFIKGLNKVALEIDENGDFKVSKKYYCKTKDDEKFVNELLGLA